MKTVEQHKKDGTYRKDRHEGRGVTLDTVVELKPPKKLTKEAKEKWNEIIPVLTKAGLISIVDQPILEDAFIQLGIAIDAINYVNANFKNYADYINSLNLCKGQLSLLSQYSVAMERFNGIMKKFGVTPYERGKIKLNPNKPDEIEATINDLKIIKGCL